VAASKRQPPADGRCIGSFTGAAALAAGQHVHGPPTIDLRLRLKSRFSLCDGSRLNA